MNGVACCDPSETKCIRNTAREMHILFITLKMEIP